MRRARRPGRGIVVRRDLRSTARGAADATGEPDPWPAAEAALERIIGPDPGRALHHARRAAADATSEPDPGPAPEAVFDRITGPYLRRNGPALPGARGCDEDA
ncbi:MAG TPA: hypothetical protein VK601_30305 [Kofleriaceae bacterium]|nr:hypothetical protein [Kofleriaceae bacterium]